MRSSVAASASIILLIITVSCGVRNTAGENDSAICADTIAVIPEEEAPIEIEELPDTAYESVALIKWETRLLDSISDPKINDLSDLYRQTPGVFAFRGNSRRDGDMGGRVSGHPQEIAVDWKFETAIDKRETGNGQSWGGGSGWTGQPVYVEWPDSLLRHYRRTGRTTDDFSGKEIIAGSLSSYLYFIDFETGKASREPINVTNPIKGSIMLDPLLNGNIYAGHGVPNERPFGALTANLDLHKVTDTFPEDPLAPRRWGAYDSSAIRAGQYVFRPGENGMIYKFRADNGEPRLHSTLSYRRHGSGPGIEASMSVYRNYGYTADNHGNILCINLNTMKPVWVYSLGDDTDSTPVIAEEEEGPMLYTGCEIDRSGREYAKYVKLNALTGERVWEKELPGRRFEINGKHFDGGFYASSLLGQGDSEHLIFINMVENLDRQNGKFMAIDRKTGETAYSIPLKHYAWSSPVGYLNEEGKMYVLTADCAGYMYLIDAREGKVVADRLVGANFESSPVVAGNSAVVGSRGKYIYKVSLR